jgi:4-hydroxythreonine-4-phosphate dehydrogenase
MGDPAGVGPELCLKLLANDEIARLCTPVIFGDATLIERVANTTGLPLPHTVVSSLADATSPCLYNLTNGLADDIIPGQVNSEAGKAAYRYLEAAIDAAINHDVAAITTNPLNKEALHAAGIDFPGHTEILAAKTNTKNYCMMQYSDAITCSFATVHVGYHEVPALLTTQRILDVIQLTARALSRIRGREPKLLVCGLNPHAGEHGLFGNREEETIIIPAIDAARQRGITLEGPVPPDTAFTPARLKEFDAVVCMYHDQGHIPVKALAFDTAVNTTLGLPIIRTSVDHGTAFDIAWQAKANPSSLYAATRLAIQLSETPPA